MELTVVGCSGSTSGPESPASSYLVRADHDGRTFSLVLDLGPGAYGALCSHVDPATVDAIGLSHLHPDHCFDVCAFYVAGRYSTTAPWPRIPLYGPPGTADRMSRAYAVEPAAGAEGEPGPSIVEHFEHRVWAPEQQVGPFVVRAAVVPHPVTTYATRVTERATGASLTFTGDTGGSDELVELARGTDLLLAESAFLEGVDNAPGVHLTGRGAAEIAQRAEVGRLVITHIPPWHDRERVRADAAPHFAGPVELAAPGRGWTIEGAQSPDVGGRD